MNPHSSRRGIWAGLLVVCVLLAGSSLLYSMAASAGPLQPPAPDDTPRLPTKQPPAPFVAGRLLVGFKPGVGEAQQEATLSQLGFSVQRRIDAIALSVLSVPAGQELELAKQISKLPNVRYAEPDYIVRAFGAPNDPYFGQQWNMTIINGPAAWDVSTGVSTTVIAIVDTGIDLTHPDLAAKIVPGYDFVNNDNTAQDDNGHGTHCAGIAAALSNNNVGVAGVNWQARLMPVKVLNSSGEGSDSDLAAGMIWAADHGAAVISMSLGGAGANTALQDAANYAYSRGVVQVAAAGNEFTAGNPVNYPAACDHVIGVAATGAQDEHAAYSNTGAYVDLAAPGGNAGASILSTYWRSNSHTYASAQGTSMAAPHVAGLAALVKAVNPALNPDQIEWAMEGSAVDLGNPGRDNVFGWGRIDALAAVRAATNPPATPTPTATPTPFNCIIQSEHPYANGFDYTWTVTNSDASAPYTRIHFARVETEPNFDVITVMDADQHVIQTITGEYPTGLWSEPVPGRTVLVRLQTDYSITAWGFCVDALETVIGVTPTPTPTPLNCLVESPHPYSDNTNRTWTVNNPDSSAQYTRVHFARLETEAGYDFVVLRDAAGIEMARYTGAYPNGLWSPPIAGAVVQVQLISDGSIVAWGFCLDAIETAPPPAWSILRPLDVPRSRLALVAVGGKLYAIGGESAPIAAAGAKKSAKLVREMPQKERWHDSQVTPLDITGVVEEYDPATNTWAPRASQPVAVSNVSAAVIGGLIYVAGGSTLDGVAVRNLQIYDPATDRWSAGAPLPVALLGAASAALDGKLYVIGGLDESNQYLNTCYRYDPQTNAWSVAGALNMARAWAGAASVGGKIYVAGGGDAGGLDLSSVEVYDPATNRWTMLANGLSAPRGGPGVAGVGDKLYVAGGGWETYLASVDVYDTTAGVWSTLEPMSYGRRTLGLAYLLGRIYAVGGWAGMFMGANEAHAAGGPLAPRINVSPRQLSFAVEQGGADGAGVTIRNDGEADLTYVVSDELVSLLPVVTDAPWVTEAPISGTVAPASSQVVSVTVNSAGLDAGQYLAQLVVASNDPASPRVVVPISMTVSAPNPVRLYFNPASSQVVYGAQFRVDIMLSTADRPVDSVDTLINFDPAILQVVDNLGNPAGQITAGTDLPLVLVNRVDNRAGQILYGAGRRLGDRPPAGTMRLATIRFRAVSQTVNPAGTPLIFNPPTQVYYNGDPILGHAENGAVTVQAPWFVGKVTLQGRGAPPSTRWTGYPITVTLLDQAGAVFRSYALTLDENGRFTILTPPSGTFDVKVKGSHTLSVLRRGVTLPTATLIDMGTLREGDVNDDDRILGDDFSLLAMAYGSRPGSPKWDARADFNGDSAVTVADFSLLAANYSQRGPLPAPAPDGVSEAGRVPGSRSASLYIVPQRQLVDVGASFEVRIVLDAGDGQFDAAEVTLAYDPQTLDVVDASDQPADVVNVGSDLPTVLSNHVDHQAGRIELGVGIAPGRQPLRGRVELARVRFKALTYTLSGLQGTPLDLLPSSEAYLAGEPQLSSRAGAAVIVALKTARVMVLELNP